MRGQERENTFHLVPVFQTRSTNNKIIEELSHACVIGTWRGDVIAVGFPIENCSNAQFSIFGAERNHVKKKVCMKSLV